jgi:hypothetical protein
LNFICNLNKMSAESESNENITWNEKLEEYFASTGEKAHCLAWIHKKAEAMFSNSSTFIDLPVIILSTLIGATSIGSKSLFGESEAAPVALGIVSIFVSILNTVGTYFAWARRAEAHRISNIQYSRMYRNISVEMSLPREERTKPAELLRQVRVEYDRLNEISPLIPPKIIKEFNHRFHQETEISQPEEVNGLEKITIYVPPKIEAITQTIEEPPPPPPVEEPPPPPPPPTMVIEVVEPKKPRPFKP